MLEGMVECSDILAPAELPSIERSNSKFLDYSTQNLNDFTDEVSDITIQ